MTLMLASVADAEEAALVARGGADIVDFKDPRRGAIGAVEARRRRRWRARSRRRWRRPARRSAIRLTRPTASLARARAFAGAGVDTLKLAVDALSLETLRAAAGDAGAGDEARRHAVRRRGAGLRV